MLIEDLKELAMFDSHDTYVRVSVCVCLYDTLHIEIVILVYY